MTDSAAPGPAAGNRPEYTVSELAGSVKRAVEDAFGHVRVRGELGRVTFAKSGHVYLDLKDERACVSSVAWKSVAARMPVKPEEGMEVIIEGRLTTYAARSQYQLIIERLEPAGVGALMALLEERKKKLAAEGLFDEARKAPIPFLPDVIGVVTSPTGAVIRDILHRLSDRFPRRVLLWPVLVQGDKAAEQVAAAISGFNSYAPTPDLPRPDVLIVARGGGSIEDLWPFNEEAVARAAAASEIPLISAVGHETDWTLIDFASDYRAPTPTGAAERAVPVRAELVERVAGLAQRTLTTRTRLIEGAGRELRAAARALGRPESILGPAQQRHDAAAARLNIGALKRGVDEKQRRVSELQRRAGSCVTRAAQQGGAELARLSPARMRDAQGRALARRADRIKRLGQALDALNPKAPLSRGYALVHGPDGHLVRAAAALEAGAEVALEFADGRRGAVIDGAAAAPAKPKAAPKSRPKPAAAKPKKGAPQGELF